MRGQRVSPGGLQIHLGATNRRGARGVIHLGVDTAAAVRAAGQVAAALAAIGLVVLTVTVDLPLNPAGTAAGRAIERPVQLGLAGVVALAALVSFRWQAAAAVLIAFAATLLGIFASVEYRPEYAVLLAALLVLPAVLVWVSWQHQRPRAAITAVAVITAMFLTATWTAARAIYDHFYGPTHPESTTADVAVDRVEWVWVGGLGPDTITVTTRLAEGRSTAALVARPTGGGEERHSTDVVAREHRVARLHLDGLHSDTVYDFRVVVDGVEDAGRGVGSFRTPAEGAFSFRVAVGSCARTGSNGTVFDAIRADDPLFYLAVGDIHYENLETTSTEPFLDAYDRLLTQPAQAALARRIPAAYVWDDHDYGPNDSDSTSPGRAAARAAYRLAVPHYHVAPGDAPINQAFTVGRVRFVLTDGRSERTDATLLGDDQVEWLVGEITAASRSHALVVWANGVPWIGAPSPGADTWAGYPEERTAIADALAGAGVTNLVIVSGDAHMVAIDDGTNSDYTTAQVGGFPVLHAAALDRPGSVKGGPYSEGVHPGGGQYGLVEIDDDGGDTIKVTLSGRTWDGRTLVELERSFTVPDR
jgi:PhoD-like phosphatase